MTKDPVVVNEGATVMECLSLFREHMHRAYPVVNERKQLIGTVSIENLVWVPKEKWNRRIDNTTMMVPFVVKENEHLKGLITKMIENRVDHVFVVNENNELWGVIATIDLLKDW